MREPTPWSAMLAASLRLGLAPAAFWRLSLKEWRAMGGETTAPLARKAFNALIARFPDQR